jgi:hypothetical protein
MLSSSVPGVSDQSPSSFAAAVRPTSSHSAHSHSHSRPPSSHGLSHSLAPHLHIPMNLNMNMSDAQQQQNLQNSIYHSPNFLQRPTVFPPHSRQPPSATSYSLPSTGLISPADSPPQLPLSNQTRSTASTAQSAEPEQTPRPTRATPTSIPARNLSTATAAAQKQRT